MKMARIQTKKIKKQYKKSKPPYVYSQHMVPVPLPRNDEVTAFLKTDLDFDMKVNGCELDLKLIRKPTTSTKKKGEP
jgi:hypothetical protein